MIDYGRTGRPDCPRCSEPRVNGVCCCPTDPGATKDDQPAVDAGVTAGRSEGSSDGETEIR